jgi:transcriptional regulator with XRE-family HTH domain
MKQETYACGIRLKTLRLIAGFSRRALEKKYGISANTIQAWETGKNPLTKKGAKRIVDILRQEELQFSTEWLLYGIGIPPRSTDEINLEISDSKSPQTIHVNLDEEETILKEVQNFKDVNSDSTVIVVMDDGMEPYYSLGDFVGGRRFYAKDIAKYIGMHCIIETFDKQIFLRQLIEGKEEDCYSAACINPRSIVVPFALQNIKINSVAPVIWIRRRIYL